MMQSRFFSLGLWAGFAALAIISGFTAVWPINQWSVAYLGQRLDSASASSVLPDPPDSHPHAEIWLADEALEAGEMNEAQKLIDPLLIDQNNILAYRVEGRVLWETENIQSALRTWNYANDYQSVIDAARQAHERGLLDDAAKAYEIASLIRPEQGVIQLVNFLWYHYNNQEMAEVHLRRALKQFPDSTFQPLWLQKLGDFLVIQQRWDEAEITYLKLLSEESYAWQAYISLGWLYYERGDGIEAARREFETSVAIDPNRGDGYLAIARLLADQGKYSEADIWFQEALSRNPNTQWWYIWRGNAAREGGNLDLAIQIYLDAVARFPNWDRSYYDLAWAYFLAGETESSKKSIEKALELMSPPNPSYLMLAGKIAELCEDYDGALSKYYEALSIDPNNLTAKQAIQLIQDKHKIGE